MASNTLPRRANDHLIRRLLMAAPAAIVDLLYWISNRPAAHKRLAVTFALTLAVASSSTLKTNGSAEAYTLPTSEVMPSPIASSDPTIYETGNLAGRRAGDLYAAYMGYPEAKKPAVTVIPATIKIDWHAQLSELWVRKTNRRGVTPVARQTAAELVAEYAREDVGQITLESYQEIAGNQASAICAELNWDMVGRTYRLNVRETALLKRVSCNMGGRVLLAYAMAELLPSTDGALNREYLDFLLRYGGRRYVESLPALHDDITSFGPVQFTQYAVYDTGRERRGASRVNVALPAGSELQIPGSTMMLRENDHFRAAYLFAVSNLADGIRKLNGRQLTVFERVAGPRGVDVAQFVATAHNKPAVGMQSLRRWLDSGARGSYRDSCPRVSRLYATKTLNNYNALSKTRS